MELRFRITDDNWDAHVLTIPDHSTEFNITFKNVHGFTSRAYTFDLPRQKKKVKKWLWLFRDDGGRIKITAHYYRNADDFRSSFLDGSVPMYAIPESLIEVEE